MNMKNRRREVDHMAESEIFLNRHVFVSIVGQEIEEKVSFKPLILTPPTKIVDNCLLLRLFRHFFSVHVPDIISKLKKNWQSEQNFDKVLYSTMGGQQSQNKQHGDTVQKKGWDMFFYVVYYGICVFYSN